ncbi:tRNA pseudouridine(55) synthase TruB [Desulfosporosinus meridiei]|uniref:tRNA pseudouridine synthase B n=1 Tax=Desulfosporosinus meridiei (strain ATCC BAA-275 / DSM 13257 / KCTC 12902 / NCIMB 13706 / S10) TaxID=768704 RepID=J7J3E6_DESMD|nr:tRNA pseudouridine(55) synthase TruB [Desulfosporosinus meridiei]AFQ45501.1 tRNA pseudouridine synthase B [Desulfosporosinus meridiei DSM 13257]
MEGIINVLKPPGMTSSDVVVWIRRSLKMKKVGHTGTLDPGVAGVLPICVGKATRLAEYITDQGKKYIAEVKFGITTDTQDAYGKVIQETLPSLDKADLERILPDFTGKISQLPPLFSAVRKEGKHLYEYARKGIPIEITPREVIIYKLNLEQWYQGEFPKAVLNIECSKGTYIRTICHDLGQTLGCGAHMSYLVRVRSGSFKIQESWTLEEIEEAVRNNDYSFILPLTAGIDLPRVSLSEVRANAFRNGLPSRRDQVNLYEESNEPYVQVMEREQLIGIGVWRKEALYPHKVFK